ncbi:hypothetical protein I7I48_10988 [Histoplasma ohiense]|nr:hypothetical protein I7I48_10988 [Histoplasma ohiense (nom. inval.)]
MSAVLGGEPAHAGISSTYADEHTQYAWATEPKPKDVMQESSYITYMYQGMRVQSKLPLRFGKLLFFFLPSA